MRTRARVLTVAAGLVGSLVLVAPWAAATAPATASAGLAKVAPSARIPSSKGCHSGTSKLPHGVEEETFCGPARVTVRVAGHVYTVKHGYCAYSKIPFTGRALVVNIGTEVLKGHPGHKPNYFGVDILTPKGRHNFTTTKDFGGLVVKGKSYSINTAGSTTSKAVVLGGGSHGTITETEKGSTKKLLATFHC